MTELLDKTSEQIVDLLQKRELSCVELMRHCRELREKYDPVLGSFISTYPREDLVKLAGESDGRRSRGEQKSLIDGIPVAVKDVIHSRGIPTTCASRILAGYLPPFDATAVARIRQAGGIVIGQTNCDQFSLR